MLDTTITHPFVSKCLFSSRPTHGINCETFGDEGASGVRYVGPILFWIKFIISCNGGIHLLFFRLVVERSVPCTNAGLTIVVVLQI